MAESQEEESNWIQRMVAKAEALIGGEKEKMVKIDGRSFFSVSEQDLQLWGMRSTYGALRTTLNPEEPFDEIFDNNENRFKANENEEVFVKVLQMDFRSHVFTIHDDNVVSLAPQCVLKFIDEWIKKMSLHGDFWKRGTCSLLGLAYSDPYKYLFGFYEKKKQKYTPGAISRYIHFDGGSVSPEVLETFEEQFFEIPKLGATREELVGYGCEVYRDMRKKIKEEYLEKGMVIQPIALSTSFNTSRSSEPDNRWRPDHRILITHPVKAIPVFLYAITKKGDIAHEYEILLLAPKIKRRIHLDKLDTLALGNDKYNPTKIYTWFTVNPAAETYKLTHEFENIQRLMVPKWPFDSTAEISPEAYPHTHPPNQSGTSAYPTLEEPVERTAAIEKPAEGASNTSESKPSESAPTNEGWGNNSKLALGTAAGLTALAAAGYGLSKRSRKRSKQLRRKSKSRSRRRGRSKGSSSSRKRRNTRRKKR